MRPRVTFLVSFHDYEEGGLVCVAPLNLSHRS